MNTSFDPQDWIESNNVKQSMVKKYADLEPSQRTFYIFGHNISHSLSPRLHNAGFAALGLPYHYRIHESESVDQSVEELINRQDFGGASVTFPHKLQVARLLDTISPKAAQIGAVNTIILKHTTDGRALVGDNTDWLGIKACIQQGEMLEMEKSSALILGAGGAALAACYALQVLGFKHIMLVNRTRGKAEAMASRFSNLTFHIFESLEEFCKNGDIPGVVVACVPADDLSEDKIPDDVFARMKVGVLVEMAYRPPKTGMMIVAAKFPGWRIFCGTDVLEQQAYAQFRLWTGSEPPVEVMRKSMVEATNTHL